MVLRSAGDGGTFATLNFTDLPLPVGNTWDVVYKPTDVEVQLEGRIVTSQACASVMLALVLFALVVNRRRNSIAPC